MCIVVNRVYCKQPPLSNTNLHPFTLLSQTTLPPPFTHPPPPHTPHTQLLSAAHNAVDLQPLNPVAHATLGSLLLAHTQPHAAVQHLRCAAVLLGNSTNMEDPGVGGTRHVGDDGCCSVMMVVVVCCNMVVTRWEDTNTNTNTNNTNNTTTTTNNNNNN